MSKTVVLKINEAVHRHIVFITMMIFASFFVLYYIFKVVILQDSIFGGDIGQYLITARALVSGEESIYLYPYPLLPAMYTLIVILVRDPYVQYKVGCILGGILFLFFMWSTYLAIYQIVKDQRYASLISAMGVLPILSYPLYYDAIGWAGQSQFLGLVLGMMCIRSYLKHNIISTIGLLIATYLAHPWTALLFLIIIALYFFINSKNTLKAKYKHLKNPITILVLMLIIILAIGLVFLLNRSVWTVIIPLEELSTSEPLIIVLLSGNVNKDILYQRLVYGQEILLITYYISPIILYAIVHLKSSRNGLRERLNIYFKNLIISLTISIALAILFSPGQYADRGLYFVPVVYVFIFAWISYKLLNIRHKIENIMTVSFIILIIFSSLLGISITTYPNALQYYSIDKQIVNLSKINDYSGVVLFASPRAYWFPASFFLGTDCVFTTQPLWFIQKKQIELVKIANALAVSNVIARASKLWVLDAEPLWAQPAPAIYLDDYPYFVEVLRLSDGFLPIFWTPLGYNMTSNSPFYADKRTTSYHLEEDYAEITTNYSWDTLSVTKSTRLFRNDTVLINISYSFVNSQPELIENDLIFLSMRNLGKDLFIDYNYGGTLAVINITQLFSAPWILKTIHTTIIVESKGVTINTMQIKTEEGYTSLVITYVPVIGGANENISISYKVIVMTGRHGVASSVTLATRESFFEAYNITYVIIDKAVHPDVLNIIERDQNFQKIAELHDYIIYAKRKPFRD